MSINFWLSRIGFSMLSFHPIMEKISLQATSDSTAASGSSSTSASSNESARLDIPVSEADAAMFGILAVMYVICSGIHIFAVVVNILQDRAIRTANINRDQPEGRRGTAISIQIILLTISIMRAVKMFMRVGYTVEGINVYSVEGVSQFFAFLTVIPYALFVTALSLVTSSWFRINLYSHTTRAQRVVHFCNIAANVFNYMVLIMSCFFIVIPAAEEHTGTASMIYFTCVALTIITALLLFIGGASRLLYLVKTSAIGSDAKFKASIYASMVSIVICLTMLIRIAFFFAGSLQNSTPLRFVGYLFEQTAIMTIVVLYFKSPSRDMLGRSKSLSLKGSETEMKVEENEKENQVKESNDV